MEWGDADGRCHYITPLHALDIYIYATTGKNEVIPLPTPTPIPFILSVSFPSLVEAGRSFW